MCIIYIIIIENLNGKIVKKKRPVNLDLTTIKFPITAISSILHRLSGIIIFFTIGFFFWLLNISLASPEGFSQAELIMKNISLKILLWFILTILLYHSISGIRFMMIDFGYIPETLKVGIRSSKIVFIITILLSIVVGVLLW
ncbi:succinate dehydrogenase, cytochrome b556 subunit [Pantoea sp. Aalb]|uniref:succinate dehydrogenase, cytochrome b556 subunit n=1 Tax=Pantoea sp. Aalb TaxID=2576762 RepID=UPI00132A597A|nr:succinate dehydrogenase, cytochrome b556 subunit [Pantoea sp. Aalb]MXP67538.1 succinate dehydrogenase, cytochrome b556 subunit [Pantoea sp. Aalb]